MAIRRFDDDIDPSALIGAETGLAPIDPFLSSVAPGLLGPSDSQFASKELNVGRSAVTGGRAFRSPVVRSKTLEEQAQEAIGLRNGLGGSSVGGRRFDAGQSSGPSGAPGLGGGGGIGSVVGKEFGLGVGANILKNIALTGATGLNVGASGGQIAGALPGTVAGAVKGAVAGPVGAGLGMLGVSDAVASPIGAANTITGLAGTMFSADLAQRREAEAISAYTGSPDISPGVRAAMERGAAPPRGTGGIGLALESLISGFGDLTGLFDTKSPAEQAALEGHKQASREKHQGTEYGLFKDIEETTPSLASRFASTVGSGLNRGLEAVGGFGSAQAAIGAGFTPTVSATGQRGWEPPSMNVFGLDDRERDRRFGGGGDGSSGGGGLGNAGGFGGNPGAGGGAGIGAL